VKEYWQRLSKRDVRKQIVLEGKHVCVRHVYLKDRKKHPVLSYFVHYTGKIVDHMEK